MMTSLQTLPKVALRAMEPEDLDMLYSIENNMELWCVGTANVPYSRYVLHDYIASSSGDIYADKQVRFVIVDDSGNTVGLVDLVNFDPQNLRAEVGIVIVQSCRNRGYGQAALLKISDYATAVLHLHQLYALIRGGNKASERLFSELGFHQSGRLEDWFFDGRKYTEALVMQKKL